MAAVTATSTCSVSSDGRVQHHDKTTQPDSYSLYRPSYHIIPRNGWLNDPCGLGYDPKSGLYHVAFQWNPKSAEWGDIQWGKATSRDLVSWSTVTQPCLSRDQAYDCAGVFTGCLRPSAPDGNQDATLTYMYTSVSRLPIHYTLPYQRGCETLSVATSRDGGITWQKHANNPILSGPPQGVDALGWRDPFVAPWPNLAKALGHKEPEQSLFGIVSGGIRNETPTSWLYKIDAKDLTKWIYLGPLIKVGNNFSPSRWSGDLGVNWEVTNFMTLHDDQGSSQDFMVFGAEGSKPTAAQAAGERVPRGQLWLAGDVSANPNLSEPMFNYSYSGIFDHGLYYAANGFWDPVAKHHVVFGWVTEEDLPLDSQIKQNWSGFLSLPRSVKLCTYNNVRRARVSKLADISSFRVEDDGKGAYMIQTMGIDPDDRLQALRKKARMQSLHNKQLGSGSESHIALQTQRWECRADFKVGRACKRVGIRIQHSDDPDARSMLYFTPDTELFSIERPDLMTETTSKSLPTECAPHTLLTLVDHGGKEAEEQLKVKAYLDGSVLEVFVNGRTAITTRVYLSESGCKGLSFWAESDGDAESTESVAVLTECFVWDDLGTT